MYVVRATATATTYSLTSNKIEIGTARFVLVRCQSNFQTNRVPATHERREKKIVNRIFFKIVFAWHNEHIDNNYFVVCSVFDTSQHCRQLSLVSPSSLLVSLAQTQIKRERERNGKTIHRRKI